MGALSQKIEATLDDILSDPIVRILMRRDGVNERQVRDLVRTASAARLARRRERLVSFCPRFRGREETADLSIAPNIEFSAT